MYSSSSVNAGGGGRRSEDRSCVSESLPHPEKKERRFGESNDSSNMRMYFVDSLVQRKIDKWKYENERSREKYLREKEDAKKRKAPLVDDSEKRTGKTYVPGEILHKFPKRHVSMRDVPKNDPKRDETKRIYSWMRDNNLEKFAEFVCFSSGVRTLNDIAVYFTHIDHVNDTFRNAAEYMNESEKHRLVAAAKKLRRSYQAQRVVDPSYVRQGSFVFIRNKRFGEAKSTVSSRWWPQFWLCQVEAVDREQNDALLRLWVATHDGIPAQYIHASVRYYVRSTHEFRKTLRDFEAKEVHVRELPNLLAVEVCEDCSDWDRKGNIGSRRHDDSDDGSNEDINKDLYPTFEECANRHVKDVDSAFVIKILTTSPKIATPKSVMTRNLSVALRTSIEANSARVAFVRTDSVSYESIVNSPFAHLLDDAGTRLESSTMLRSHKFRISFFANTVPDDYEDLTLELLCKVLQKTLMSKNAQGIFQRYAPECSFVGVGYPVVVGSRAKSSTETATIVTTNEPSPAADIKSRADEAEDARSALRPMYAIDSFVYFFNPNFDPDQPLKSETFSIGRVVAHAYGVYKIQIFEPQGLGGAIYEKMEGSFAKVGELALKPVPSMHCDIFGRWHCQNELLTPIAIPLNENITQPADTENAATEEEGTPGPVLGAGFT